MRFSSTRHSQPCVFSGAVLILFVFHSTVGDNVEAKHKEYLIKTFDNVAKNWYLEAVESLITAVGDKRAAKLPTQLQLGYQRCSKFAKGIYAKAKCTAHVFDMEEKEVVVISKHRSRWIGQFKLEENEKLPRSKRSLHSRFPDSYLAERDIIEPKPRRQTKLLALGNSSGDTARSGSMFVAGKVGSKFNCLYCVSPVTSFSKLVISFLHKSDEEVKPFGSALSRVKELKNFMDLHENIADPAFKFDENTAQRADDRIEFLSPRFLPIVPDRRKKISKGRFLSPTIFPLYQDDSYKPVSGALSTVGLEPSDQEALLELVLEASGASKQIDSAFQKLEELNKTIQLASLNIERAMKELAKTFLPQQKSEFNNYGYTFLTRKQMDQLYGKDGPYGGRASVNLELDAYEKWTRREKDDFIKQEVRRIASYDADEHRKWASRRLKQEGGVSGGITTLTPFAFSPSINILTTLGPITLSPYIFSPSILNPAVISPTTLSPSIFSPQILAPYVLSPESLSPQVADPGILSPYVLSPNVVKSFALSPNIVSPYVLSPDIISPKLIDANVLSPSVLSPVYESDGLIIAEILSPTLLSRKKKR